MAEQRISDLIPVYYSGTGLNMNGAMTQAATTTALTTKQSTLVGQQDFFLSNSGLTLPNATINNSVRLNGGSGVTKLFIPTPELTDVGSIIRIQLDGNTNGAYVDTPLDLYWRAPGSPNSSFGPQPAYDAFLVQLRSSQSVTFAAVKIDRGTPYRDSVTAWIPTSIINSETVDAKANVVVVTNPGPQIDFVQGYYYSLHSTLYQRTAPSARAAGSTLLSDATKFAVAAGARPAPSAVRSAVASGIWTNGELQSTQPQGSGPGMKFCDANYRYEYVNGMNDTDGTSYVWVRTTKA